MTRTPRLTRLFLSATTCPLDPIYAAATALTTRAAPAPSNSARSAAVGELGARRDLLAAVESWTPMTLVLLPSDAASRILQPRRPEDRRSNPGHEPRSSPPPELAANPAASSPRPFQRSVSISVLS